MKELPPLDGLSDAEKDALIRGLWQELQALRAEIEQLKQKRVKKTARNSSLLPVGLEPGSPVWSECGGTGDLPALQPCAQLSTVASVTVRDLRTTDL